MVVGGVFFVCCFCLYVSVVVCFVCLFLVVFLLFCFVCFFFGGGFNLPANNV